MPTANYTYTNSNSVFSFTNTSQGGSRDLVWDFGDGSFSNLGNPVHDFQSAGQFNVKLIVNNSCGKDSIIKTINSTVSIDQSLYKSLKIFPNPTNNLLNIQFEPYQDGITGIKLISTLGKIVMDDKILINGAYNGVIDLGKYGKGIYYLQISNSKGNSVRKIVVN